MRKKQTIFVLGVALLALAAIMASRVRQGVQEEQSSARLREERQARFRKIPPGALEAVDLLKMIDPAQDSVAGAWHFDGPHLLSPVVQDYARREGPCGPPDEYDLDLAVERLGATESFVIGLVSGDRQFTIHLDAKLFGVDKKLLSPCCSGLRMIDGRADNETVRDRAVLGDSGVSQITCSVRKTGVSVRVNGSRIIDWKGEASRLSLPRQWKVRNPRALFLGSYNCQYRVSRAVLKPV